MKSLDQIQNDNAAQLPDELFLRALAGAIRSACVRISDCEGECGLAAQQSIAERIAGVLEEHKGVYRESFLEDCGICYP